MCPPDAQHPDAVASPDGPNRPASNGRRMTKGTLLGQHTHASEAGVTVNIWLRGATYLARGRCDRKAFGETLGNSEQEAVHRLRHLLVEIDNGGFIRASDRPRRQLRRGLPPRLDVRGLCDEFLSEKRGIRGQQTARDYRNRLAPLIEFAERPDVRRRCRLAAEVDRQFALDFRCFLSGRQVARNGRASGAKRPRAPGQVYNVLDCCRTLYNWARKPEVNRLPSWQPNPFTDDLVGQRPGKDPLRSPVFPLDLRIRLVAQMDPWQLLHLSPALVLPLRPEDFCGLLIADVDFRERVLHFGPRFGGGDFNKGRQAFDCPFPEELAPLLQACVGSRRAGPLLRQRQIWNAERKAILPVDADEDVTRHVQGALANAPAGKLQAPGDWKLTIRRCIRQMGGMSEDGYYKELKQLIGAAGIGATARPYDLRGSISTELNIAGVMLLEQRYVTGHGTRDIQNQYVSLRPTQQMQKYFDTLGPLYEALDVRARQLGLDLSRWTAPVLVRALAVG